MAKLTLTPQQQAVVENRGGSLLVSAAAGSGKTKVLVDRLFRYVTEERCNIDDFLIITYTKAAAAELRSKIASELSKRLAPGRRGTSSSGGSCCGCIRRTSRPWTPSARRCCGKTPTSWPRRGTARSPDAGLPGAGR